MRRTVVAGLFVFLAISLRADSQLIPLVDPSDPILITNSILEFEDTGRSVMTLELENRAAVPVSTGEIWLDRARFFTKAEALAAGNRRVWDCGTSSSAAGEGRSAGIAPGRRMVVRLDLVKSCDYHRDHEHFFVGVTRIGKFAEPDWKREPEEFSRLLHAAQPHP